MGCSSSVQTLYHPSKKFTQSPVGLLSVTIVSFSLSGSHNFLFSKQIPHVKITVSNQTYSTKKNIQAEADQQTSIDETFQFTINSCYQENGRQLDCQVWSDSFLIGGKLGHGQINLNDIINNSLTKEVTCSIYQGDESRGNIKLKIGFTSYPYDNLSFKMVNALVINKRDEELSKRKIYIRIQIGEEILQTKPSAENPKMLPHWENEILIFRIPSFCEAGKITVCKSTKDSDLEIGSFQIDMPNLLQTRTQRIFDEIFSVMVEGKEQVKGTLKFETLKDSTNFIELRSPRKERKNLPKYEESLLEPAQLMKRKTTFEEKMIDEEKRKEREQMKNKLLSPLPVLNRKKISEANNYGFIALHRVEVQNPEP